jgi:hypothetical protein
MGYVDDAFAKLKSGLEITPTESAQAIKRHTEIRDHVKCHLQLCDDFLTGSYRRGTKTKRLKDVDIFCVVKSDGSDGDWRDLTPAEVLSRLKAVLEKKYPSVTIGRRCCTIEFGKEDAVVSFDIVPAFDRDGGGYEIPDKSEGKWIASNPRLHHEKTKAKNKDCAQLWVPFVKMVKGWNREWDKPVRPSFLLEVMALKLVRPPFRTYPDEIAWFLATAAEQITNVWDDPAGLGPDVNSSMTVSEKTAAAGKLLDAQAVAERAIELQDEGKERAAVEAWRELFGNRMPRPY